MSSYAGLNQLGPTQSGLMYFLGIQRRLNAGLRNKNKLRKRLERGYIPEVFRMDIDDWKIAHGINIYKSEEIRKKSNELRRICHLGKGNRKRNLPSLPKFKFMENAT